MARKTGKNPATIISKLDDLLGKAKHNIFSAETEKELETERVKSTGRKSELTKILRNIKDLDNEAKKLVGSKANQVRTQLDAWLEERTQALKLQKFENIATEEAIDVTLPTTGPEKGHLHPISTMLELAENIFQRMGFEIYYPYELDNDYNNFEALNMPPGHPARDSWDTFWTTDGSIAITHTSSMQNRVLKSHEPPIRAIVPGRCFRNEATDARHEHTFFQIEGIYVDKGISLGHMLGTLKAFFTEFFNQETKIKFTPDFFPFVEPGGMMSLTCILCQGKGCAVCKYSGWLEVLGCGMIHPKVLSMAGIDPQTYTGFAWGFGLERLLLLKYGIEDIRHFYQGNLKFIRQF